MMKINTAVAYMAAFFTALSMSLSLDSLAQSSDEYNKDMRIIQVRIGSGQSTVSESLLDLSQSSDHEEIELDKLKKLAFDNVPTIYFKEGLAKQDEERFPQRLISDVASIDSWGSMQDGLRTIKLLQIDLNQAQEKSFLRLNPEKLKLFTNLTYILIKSTVTLTKEEVNRMLSGYEEGDIILLYQVNMSF